MKSTKRILAAMTATVLVVLTGAAVAAPRSFGLHVDEASGWEAPMPLKGGVPFPQGALQDARHIRLADSEGQEVPVQVDVAGTYPDGSVRWAILSFHASPAQEFRVEFGEGVERLAPTGLRLEEKPGGGIEIDTGAARFLLDGSGLLLDEAHLRREGGEEQRLFGGGGGGAYLEDNRGRLARVAGEAADIQTRILKQGPMRATLRREGWYVADDGDRLARGIVRMSFYNGSAAVKLSHTLVFTEDTNDLWVRDYGMELPFEADGVATARFDVSRSLPENPVFERPLGEGESLAMLQDTFPHFLSTESRFAMRFERQGEAAEEVLQGPVAGDWVALDSAQKRLTLVLPELAEQFPKEMQASPEGIRVRLWAGTSGRELDFRAETLVEEYWGEWAKNPPRIPTEGLLGLSSNAQSSAKTHEMWLLPHASAKSAEGARQRAEAFRRPTLVYADPHWTARTEAIGWPLHPHDPERFPQEEAMIEQVWERTFLPEEVFPMTGFIAWGAQPAHSFEQVDGKWAAQFRRLSHLIDYGLRERTWNLFARSGDRRYIEFGRRFNRFTFDWGMHHWDAGRKFRGGFSTGRIHTPFYWGTSSTLLFTSSSGYTLQNFLLEYFMTGNEMAREAVEAFGEAVKERWDPDMPLTHPSTAVRVLTHCYMLDGDEEFLRMARHLARERLIDLSSPNGINPDIAGGRPLYKVHRMALALYEYYQASGDAMALDAFLKTVDFERRFNRISRPVSGQEFGAFLMTIAYRMTEDPAYHRALQGMMEGGLAMEDRSLQDDLDAYGYQFRDRPRVRRPVHENIHPMLGMPTAMALLAQEGEAPGPYAWAVKSGLQRSAVTFMQQEGSEPARFRVFVRTPPGQKPNPRVMSSDGEEIGGLRLEAEEQTLSHIRGGTGIPGERQFHLTIQMPSDALPGPYRLTFDEWAEFVVLDSSVAPLALYAPEGFWGGRGGITGVLPQYFHVPEGTETLRLMANTSNFWLRRPDGTPAIRPEDGCKGELEVPVEGNAGFWSVQAIHPVFWQLLNVPPVVSAVPQSALSDRRLQELQAEADALAESRQPAQPDQQFVAGPRGGKALHLPEGRTFRFRRGDGDPASGYEHFPADQGTIEFWFRPNWDGSAMPHPPYELTNSTFLSAGSVDLAYRHGVGWSSAVNYSHLYPGLHGAPGGLVRSRDRHLYRGHWFRQGEWVHVAMTWKVRREEGQSAIEASVFIGGRRLGEPELVERAGEFRLKEAAEWIQLGPELDGSVSDLRISDSVRYTDHFAPPAPPLELDGHTLALFAFDEERAGLSGTGQDIPAEVIE